MPSIDRQPATSLRPPAPRADTLITTQPHELAEVLRAGDPWHGTFAGPVRRFVRAERTEGRDLDAILAVLTVMVRAGTTPGSLPTRRDALQRAVAWLAVSEYHRAD